MNSIPNWVLIALQEKFLENKNFKIWDGGNINSSELMWQTITVSHCSSKEYMMVTCAIDNKDTKIVWLKNIGKPSVIQD